MPRFSYEYTRIPLPPTPAFPAGVTVDRPLLIVTLQANAAPPFSCIALADSGADRCLFPLSFAVGLGLDPHAMKSNLTGGVGNAGNLTFYGNAQITISNGPSFDGLVGFTSGLESLGIGLLGQADFFEKFRVTFDHAEGLFHIDSQ